MLRHVIRFTLKFAFVLIVFIVGVRLGVWIANPYKSAAAYVERYAKEYRSMTDDDQSEFRYRVKLLIREEIPEFERLYNQIEKYERELEEEGRAETTTQSSIDWQEIREYWQNWLDKENARLEGVQRSENTE